ncbi:ATP-binding protein [Streptomyces sp. NPDC001118]|uniref:ATP-binding protein n=1 Tax=unclassified Streptomyces TaxID=2593676 RepID=UPI00332E93A9
MSLPLTRRIARAALLVAAGAAAGVGAAGSAGAATNLPAAAPNLSGVTTPDATTVGTVGEAAQNVSSVATTTGGNAVGHTLPGVTKASSSTLNKTTPVAGKAAGQTARTAGSVIGDAARTGAPELPSVPGGALPLG